MSLNFDGLLKASLAVVNDGFQRAVSDLNDMASEVDAAIKRNANARFGLSVSELTSDMKGSTYNVYFDPNIHSSKSVIIDVAYFRVPASGYPISIGLYQRNTRNFYPEASISDRGELESVFERFLQDPESALIQAVGYALRSSGHEDDIPF